MGTREMTEERTALQANDVWIGQDSFAKRVIPRLFEFWSRKSKPGFLHSGLAHGDLPSPKEGLKALLAQGFDDALPGIKTLSSFTSYSQNDSPTGLP